MRLRNKKTGEIDDFTFESIIDRVDLYRRVGHSETKNIWHYDSLAELNDEWEDYDPSKDFRPEHLKRMGICISKGGKE